MISEFQSPTLVWSYSFASARVESQALRVRVSTQYTLVSGMHTSVAILLSSSMGNG